MTKEDSLIQWKLEKAFVQVETLSKPLQKLYAVVDKCINEGVLMYDEFNSDMIDEITNKIINNTKENVDENRAQMVDDICKELTKKYEAKYKNRESLVGNEGVSVDNMEIQDGSGVCESECTTESC